MAVEHHPKTLDRNVETLEGDVVRTHLSKGLGFSREDRDIHLSNVLPWSIPITRFRRCWPL